MRNKDGFSNCVGTVNVLLESRVVLQGQIIKGNRKPLPSLETNSLETNNRFLVLRLACDASLLTDDALFRIIEPPLYQEGDIVRVNLDQVASIGPSSGCAEDEPIEE